jgi:1,4-alpha-glucan branching enzyme
MAFVVRAPGATRVEVTGDFSNWEPVALSRAETGEWSAVLQLTRGTYRFNVRIDDGPWIVPAGVSRLEDEFGGDVGLLRVP